VRTEITRALARGITVIPVLVGGAALPRSSDLPADLKPLSERQAVTVTTNSFRTDMAGLEHDLRAIVRAERRWPLPALGATALLLALAAFGYVGLQHDGWLRSPPMAIPSTPGSPPSKPVAANVIQPDFRRGGGEVAALRTRRRTSFAKQRDLDHGLRTQTCGIAHRIRKQSRSVRGPRGRSDGQSELPDANRYRQRAGIIYTEVLQAAEQF
jgi:hypothetical protein